MVASGPRYLYECSQRHGPAIQSSSRVLLLTLFPLYYDSHLPKPSPTPLPISSSSLSLAIRLWSLQFIRLALSSLLRSEDLWVHATEFTTCPAIFERYHWIHQRCSAQAYRASPSLTRIGAIGQVSFFLTSEDNYPTVRWSIFYPLRREAHQ